MDLGGYTMFWDKCYNCGNGIWFFQSYNKIIFKDNLKGSICRKCEILKSENIGKVKEKNLLGKKLQKITTHVDDLNWLKDCAICSEKFSLITHLCCKYCESWFCEKHRLPETHNCKGNPKNPHKYGGRFKYSRHGIEYLGFE